MNLSEVVWSQGFYSQRFGHLPYRSGKVCNVHLDSFWAAKVSLDRVKGELGRFLALPKRQFVVNRQSTLKTGPNHFGREPVLLRVAIKRYIIRKSPFRIESFFAEKQQEKTAALHQVIDVSKKLIIAKLSPNSSKPSVQQHPETHCSFKIVAETRSV